MCCRVLRTTVLRQKTGVWTWKPGPCRLPTSSKVPFGNLHLSSSTPHHTTNYLLGSATHSIKAGHFIRIYRIMLTGWQQYRFNNESPKLQMHRLSTRVTAAALGFTTEWRTPSSCIYNFLANHRLCDPGVPGYYRDAVFTLIHSLQGPEPCLLGGFNVLPLHSLHDIFVCH